MIKQMNHLLMELKQLKEREQILYSEIQDLANQLEKEELESLSYGEIKTLEKEIRFFLNTENKKSFDEILESRKKETYPELKKPTYFPEIDTLPISDEEKLRIDKAARNAIRYYISEENCKKLQDPLTIEDLDLLTSIGVAEKSYAIFCRHCGSRQKLLLETELNKFKKAWELTLKEKSHSITDTELDQLDKLYEEGYYSLYIYCMDCDEEDEIENEEELRKYNIQTYYKIVKKPNLKYENL